MTARTLTGRDRELGQALSAVLAGSGVALVGPAGVGKTALATVFEQRLDPTRYAPVRVAATEASRPIPFGALASVLSLGAGPVEPALVLGRIAAELATRAGRRKPVLVVDDAHHLDGPSAAVMLGLAANSRARLIVTVRARARPYA
jgi:type II secretory pathway predicted ATPase ExeA